MPTIRKILVPVDFSSHSGRALEDAIALAKEWGAELHLLHCYPIHPAAIDPYGIAVPASLEAEIRQTAERRLGEWRDRAAAEGVAVQEHITAHLPSEEIPAAAERLGVDLIVMGTRGLSGFKHVLLGSITERVLRAAPCPVWVVRDTSG